MQKGYSTTPNIGIVGDCVSKVKVFTLTLLHSERPKLYSFGLSECNRVKVFNMMGKALTGKLSCMGTCLVKYSAVCIEGHIMIGAS